MFVIVVFRIYLLHVFSRIFGLPHMIYGLEIKPKGHVDLVPCAVVVAGVMSLGRDEQQHQTGKTSKTRLCIFA